MVHKILFHDRLKSLMHSLVHEVFDITQHYPKEEIYGITSQMRRAALSIILNYIEGFARKRAKVLKNFYETSYGSLQEVKYLVLFSYERKYLSKSEYDSLMEKVEEIGKMLWSTINNLE